MLQNLNSDRLVEGGAYSKRLAKITSGLTQVGDVPLNFKVYQTMAALLGFSFGDRWQVFFGLGFGYFWSYGHLPSFEKHI